MITFSIVIPCYNVEAFIEDAIISVLRQTIQPEEIICVDDCSTDNTAQRIRNLQVEYPGKIFLVENSVNRGASFSRNRGLSISKGTYIQFLDADDILLPSNIELHSALITSSTPTPDILVGSFKKQFVDGKEKPYIFQTQNPWGALFEGMLGVTSSLVFCRESLMKIKGWNEETKSSQEYEMMFRLLQKNATVVFDQRILNINRDRLIGSISRSLPIKKWERFIQLRIAIYNFLKAENKLTPELIQKYVDAMMNAVRILYLYDKKLAISIYEQHIKPVGKPDITESSLGKYIWIFEKFGFKVAQALSMLRNKDPKKVY